MGLEHRPEVLLQLAKQRHEAYLREAQRQRVLRTNRHSGAYANRLAYRVGGVLCALGNRLQNRHIVLGE